MESNYIFGAAGFVTGAATIMLAWVVASAVAANSKKKKQATLDKALANLGRIFSDVENGILSLGRDPVQALLLAKPVETSVDSLAKELRTCVPKLSNYEIKYFEGFLNWARTEFSRIMSLGHKLAEEARADEERAKGPIELNGEQIFQTKREKETQKIPEIARKPAPSGEADRPTDLVPVQVPENSPVAHIPEMFDLTTLPKNGSDPEILLTSQQLSRYDLGRIDRKTESIPETKRG